MHGYINFPIPYHHDASSQLHCKSHETNTARFRIPVRDPVRLINRYPLALPKTHTHLQQQVTDEHGGISTSGMEVATEDHPHITSNNSCDHRTRWSVVRHHSMFQLVMPYYSFSPCHRRFFSICRHLELMQSPTDGSSPHKRRSRLLVEQICCKVNHSSLNNQYLS